jgi:hypothetical protein
LRGIGKLRFFRRFTRYTTRRKNAAGTVPINRLFSELDT